MVSQPQNPNSSHPGPLFAAELDARSPDGSRVFEVNGEPGPAKDNNNVDMAYPGRKDTSPNSQARPWVPYPDDDDDNDERPPITGDNDQRPPTTGYNVPNEDGAVPAALAIKFAGRPAGSDAPAEVRPLAMRPASPSGNDSFVPAPLNIHRPQQSSPPPSSPKQYKPYQPPSFLQEPKSPSAAGPNKHEPGQAYKPYRRPSYDERQSAAAVPTAASPSDSGVVGSAPTSPVPAAQPFRLPSPAGMEQQSLAAVPPGPSPDAPTGSSPALGQRTPSPSVRPYQPPYVEHEADNQAHMSPPPVPFKTRPPAVESSVHQEHQGSAGPRVPQQAENLHASPSSPPVPPKCSSPLQPAEVVLWPHPTASGPSPAAVQSPTKPPVSASSPGPSKPTTPVPEKAHKAPIHVLDPTPIPVESEFASTIPPSISPPLASPHSPQPAQQSSAFVPQATYASSTTQNAEASARPSKFPQFPEADQSIPSDPPPPYMPSATHGPGSYSVPSEKPSLFPPPPQMAAHLPSTDFPNQPTYASSQSQPTSPLPQIQSPPSLYEQPPSQPPPSLGQASAQPPPSQQGQQFPNITPSPQAQDDCLPPPGPPPGALPSTTQYAYTPLPGQTYHVLQPPPPLPPRPSTSHAYPTVGLSSNQVNSMAYPPPPKTHYVAPPATATGSSYASSSSQRPAGGKLFGSSVAGKWLGKASQALENKVEEILQNHPDPRFRPQTGSNSNYAPQQPQYATPQPNQQSSSPYGPIPQPQWPPPQGGPSS